LGYFWASFDRLLGGYLPDSGRPTHNHGLPRLSRCWLTSFILHLLLVHVWYRKSLK